MTLKRMAASGRPSRRYKDYTCGLNRLCGHIATSRAVKKLNRWLQREVAEVVRGHPTLIRVRGVAHSVLVKLLIKLLDPRGSVVIVRRRGDAATWLLRPLANQPVARI